jgi:hypothetical protein
MPFQKGKSGNEGGRLKGSKNKPKPLRLMIESFLDGRFESVKRDLRKVDARDRLRFYIDLLPYGLPRLQSVDMDVRFENLTDEQLDTLYSKVMASINPDHE